MDDDDLIIDEDDGFDPDLDTVDNDDDEELEEDEPTLTFQVKNGRIRSKFDELPAMVQAVDKILRTERFVYPIYSDQYGNDLPDLFGKSFSYACVEIQRMLEEALLDDDRITDLVIDSIQQQDSTTLFVKGTCTTIYGQVPIESEVKLGDTR
ncbi:DUF2634 domain-containing protein [Lactobacillus sp. ESL0681]|nr:DUF2634 domain-containing protein [Lactobacillus sp. ESL0681]WEV41261.1 DUF2634 domain-containing protein [Lactobacillus sp. ESL0681]